MDLSSYAASAGASAPTAPSSPSIGYPSDGNPTSGAPATIPGAYWFYQVQQEIHHLLTTAGITPAAGTLTQLAAAVAALASGVSYESVVENIKVNGVAALGVRNTCARGDHVHPTDTTRAPLASPTFTGVPAAPTAAPGTDTTQLATTAFVAAAIAAMGAGASVPVGTVIAFSASSAPSGYLLCNGSTANRTTYAGLFSVIGTTYGVGNGSTTFALPDYRGLFLRGLDLGAGLDSGRSLGSLQNGSLVAFDTGVTPALQIIRVMTGYQTTTGAQALLGYDNFSAGDYPNVVIGGCAMTDSVALPGNTDRYAGLARPVNRSVYYYIKY